MSILISYQSICISHFGGTSNIFTHFKFDKNIVMYNKGDNFKKENLIGPELF